MMTSWEAIIGQAEPIRRLRQMLREDRLPHALLLLGPAGVGKRLTAEAAAATILCARPADAMPCGSCPSCQALQAGAHPNLYRLEPEKRGKAAPVLRIEAVRELQTDLSRAPAAVSAGRVVVIDGADRMNEAAANCLLKTLEEPGRQVVFLLIASARAALLDTVVSRCLVVPFGPLSEADIAHILTERGLAADEAASLAALSGGSAGRALTLHEDGALERRDDALRILASLPKFDMEHVWAEGKRLGALSAEELAEWLRFFRLALRDLLALYSGCALRQRDIAGRLAPLVKEYPESRVFSLVALTSEAERRLLTSNANSRLLMEALPIQMTETAEDAQ
ncbi:MAG: DNA polymerase III subunit delta' [Schwartzia sp.]|nr:DNA polymerase III subunit delta' [Schwartzia sp. (in: firmicutes)]